MEFVFLALLLILLAFALGSGYPVAFALPGAAIVTISIAAVSGYLLAGDVDAFFAQDGPQQWLSAGVTNLRGIYWEVERDTLIAIPLFIFMGIMLQRSKIAEDLLITMAQLFGPVPGGLGISVVFVGALLAATTGIVGATVVAMGLISLPVMLRNNYSQALATGTIAASGTLGQIIPPSIVLIILADQLASATDQAGSARKALHKASTGELTMPSEFSVTSTSAGEMFLGALVPGLVLVGLYMAYILIYAILRPSKAPAVRSEGAYDSRFIIKVLGTLIPPLALIFLVLGSIITGIATVNQAGAIGATGALLMAGYRLKEGKRKYGPAILALIAMSCIAASLILFDTNIKNIKTDWDRIGVVFSIVVVVMLVISLVWSGIRVNRENNTLHEVMVETAKATSLVFIILLGAAMLTAAFRAFGGEDLVRDYLNNLPGGFWAKFITVMAVIFVLGFFLDFIEIAVVVVPIVAPILLADPGANITAVWLGVMIGLNIQTSFLTPPFGFALFYLRGVAPAFVKTINMYKGVIAFIVLQLIALGIVGYYPSLVNYLPNRVSLLSDTAPPPRNPKLQYCVEEYTAEQFSLTGNDLQKLIGENETLDFSVLPERTAKSVEGSFESARGAIELLAVALTAENTLNEYASEYRPLHTIVREAEVQVRDIDDTIKKLQTDRSRILGDQESKRDKITARIEALKKEQETLLASFPPEWEEVHGKYTELRKAEQKTRNEYRRAADSGYEPIANLRATLDATNKFKELEKSIPEMRQRILDSEPAELLEPLAKLSKEFGGLEGTSDIKSAISKARSELKKKNPSQEKALDSIDRAISEYEAQIEWRVKADQMLTEKVIAYEEQIRKTIGIRKQQRLTREQALYVAKCSAEHRDISLNF